MKKHTAFRTLIMLLCLAYSFSLTLLAPSPALAAEAEKEVVKPSIAISNVPPKEATPGGEDFVGEVSGKVAGVKPKECKVVIYALGGDRYYVQPWADRPLTDIEDDLTFEAKTRGGTEYVAVLVKVGYKVQSPIAILPKVGGQVLDVAKMKPKK